MELKYRKKAKPYTRKEINRSPNSFGMLESIQHEILVQMKSGPVKKFTPEEIKLYERNNAQ